MIFVGIVVRYDGRIETPNVIYRPQGFSIMEVLKLKQSMSEGEKEKEKKKVTCNPVSEVLKLLPRIVLLLRKDIYGSQTGQRVSSPRMTKLIYW